jgi:hypothetical protein
VRSFIVTRPFNMFVVGHSLATDDDRCLVLNRILRKLALVRHVVMFFQAFFLNLENLALSVSLGTW